MQELKTLLFISLFGLCLAEQLGYNYQPTYENPITIPLAPQPESYNVPQHPTQQYVTPQLQYQVPTPQLQYQVPTLPESYRKEFYSFAAPEDDFQDIDAAQKIAAAVQKNVRVIFIRTPQHKALEDAALTLAKQSSEDRTAIYVLNQQSDVGALAQRLQSIRDQHAKKPQVHFIKYRTPAEAAHAQQYIQSHYNALQGTTHQANEAVAPVLNFASPALQPVSVAPVSVAPVQTGEAFSVNPALAGYNGGTSSLNGYYGSNAIASNGIYETAQYNAQSYAGDYNAVAQNYGNAVYDNNVLGRSFQETAVPKLNERPATGSKFSFPTEATSANTYLPALQKKKRQLNFV